jgi:hypothetical protein
MGTAEAAEKQRSKLITWCNGNRKHWSISGGVKLAVDASLAPLAFRVVFAFTVPRRAFF